MHCPLCQKAMRTADARGAEVDHCTGCSAVWFDTGELAAALGLPTPDEAGVRLGPGASSARLSCPRGPGRLREVQVETAAGVPYDGAGEQVHVCPDCRGMLLSRKALDRARTEGLRGADTPSDNPDRMAGWIEGAVEVASELVSGGWLL